MYVRYLETTRGDLMGDIHSACVHNTWTHPGARCAEGLHRGASLKSLLLQSSEEESSKGCIYIYWPADQSESTTIFGGI